MPVVLDFLHRGNFGEAIPWGQKKNGDNLQFIKILSSVKGYTVMRELMRNGIDSIVRDFLKSCQIVCIFYFVILYWID